MEYLKARKPKELKPEELKWTCDLDCFDFETTNTLAPIEGIVGQERAMKALKMGVDLRSQGYNIFITGLSGTGKFSSIKKLLETISPRKVELIDYVYVNNFKDDDHPTLLTFAKGKAKQFKKDLAATIKFFQKNIPQILETEPFISKKDKLVELQRKAQHDLMTSFEKKLRKNSLTVGQMKVGEILVPEVLAMVGNEPFHFQQLDELVEKKKLTARKAQSISKKIGEYRDELQGILKKNMHVNKEFNSNLEELEKATIKDIVVLDINELKKKYKDKNVREYLDQVAQDIPENLEVFKGQKNAEERTEEGYIIDYLKEYEVNIILDNSAVNNVPVIIETTPTYSNLFGTIEKYSDGMGGWHADFTRVKSGSLLRANGGFLVINAVDAFTEPGVWKTIKRVLIYGKLEIQDIANIYQFSPSVLQPEPIEINTKIILIGNSEIYSILSNYEDDFNKIFKIKAEFDYEMKRTNEALVEYAKILKKLVDKEKLLEFDVKAIGKITEYGARYAGQKDKLTTRFAYIADLAREASFWACDVGETLVTNFHVTQAYNSMRERHNLYESKLEEMYDNGTILIDISGTRVGQINGLAVYGSGMHSFGKPARITASVGLGTGNIINVERESGLSGNTHNKGMLILSGYFREKFGKKIPLSFSASLVFEQGYGLIDGDSASVTEICALLSALSEIPIKQSIAITGSVNQKGDIQPIGGVNEKIEGFFNLCKASGLTGKHGVVIPFQNIKDLMLNDEVVEAVQAKKFHIYPVKSVDEAAEILMGVKAGNVLASGKFEANSIFCFVERKLKEMRIKLRPIQQKANLALPVKKTRSKKKK